MDFNKNSTNYMIDSKDNNHRSNSKIYSFNSLDFIDFNFDGDNVNSNLDNNDFRKELDHLKSTNHEKLSDLDSNMEFKDSKNINSFNELNSCSGDRSFIDVRIITEDLNNAEILSKSIKYLDFKTDLGIVISAIIPVDDLKMIINAVRGADIVLVTNDYDFDNYNGLNDTNSEFKEVNYDNEAKKKISYYNDKLKDLVGYVGILKFPKTRNYEIVPEHFFQDEIKKSLMKAGFNSLFNMAKLNQVNLELDLKNKEIFKFLKLNKKLKVENESILNEDEIIRNENQELKKEIKALNIQIDELKSEFSDFKDRFSDIHNKDILEIFPLYSLWENSFNEVLTHENQLILATNECKPDNVIVGQGLIGAISRSDAVEWLKIVRTSLIFINHSPDLLKDFDRENQIISSSNQPTFHKGFSNDKDDDFKKEDEFFFNLLDD
ncbi:MAG: hypothetical protein LBB45_07005 [Methanobrevibacter sp.]|jgi:predicted nuclease with TOPRIM domain|nr:hypothetical protein [Candidatus Methanovirga basalitermitum]